MEEKKYEDDGISLTELFHIIFKRKWILLGITAFIFIVSIICSKFIINRNKEYYTVTFSLDYPESSNDKYPDGTSFNYRKIISFDNLIATKALDQGFNSIDIDSLYDTNSIKITEVTKNDAPTGEYIIGAKAKYFSSKKIAKKFLSELTNIPIDKVNEIISQMDYDSNLSSYKKSMVYDSQINYLIAQKDFILNGYNNLINYYSSGLMIYSLKDSEGKTKTVKEYLAEFTIYFDNNDIDSLKSELEVNGYVKDETYLETIVLQRDALIKEKKENENKIEALTLQLKNLVNDVYSGSSLNPSYEAFNTQIADLTTRNVELDSQIELLNKYINESSSISAVDKASFEAKLENYYKALEEFTTTYKNVMQAAYSENSMVDYNDNSIIILEGSVKTAYVAILGLVGGFVVASCIILIMDLPKYKKNNKEITE